MRYLFSFLFFLYGLSTCLSQSVWELKEQRPNGKVHTLDTTRPHHHIDISSLIYITPDTDYIRNEVAKTAHPKEAVEKLLTKVRVLNKLTAQGMKSIPGYTEGLDAYAKARTVAEKENIINAAGKNFASNALQLIDISKEDPELRVLLNNRLHEVTATGNNSWAAIFLQLLKETERYAATLNGELDNLLEKEGIYIQVAATLHRINGDVKQSVHIDGFDHFKPPEYYDPYALNLALTDEQIREIEQLKKVSDSINKMGIPVIFNRQKEQIQANLNAMLTEMDSLLNDLYYQTEKIMVSDIPVEAIREEYFMLKRNIITLQAEISDLYPKYFSGNFSFRMETLESIISDIYHVINRVELITDHIIGLKSTIDRSIAILPQNVATELNALNDSLENMALKKIDQANEALSLLYTELTGYRSFDDINQLSAAFSDKVLRKNIKDLPEKALLNVKFHAGYREEGDNIVLEMRSGKKSGEPQTLAKEYFTLLKTQPHFVTNIGIAFVKPEGGGENFKAVVSSNTLFKFGVKGNNTFYRKFIDIGIGINVATLNFDAGNPFEFGAAPVVSAFNDYLIGGYGYNFTQGKGYLLVSIRVPFFSKELIF